MTSFRVNFLIVGAQKSGTTALAHYLAQHPQVCFAPAKEVHFFDDPTRQTSDWAADSANEAYQGAFPNWSGQPVVGEGTPIYLYLPETPRQVRAYNPDMRIVILLRDPVERALSHYNHERRLGRESQPLVRALALERWRLWRDRGNLSEESSVRRHSYVDRGRYARQIRRWMACFPRSQILILAQEDLLHRQEETLRRVYDHLELTQPAVIPAPCICNSFPYESSTPAWLRRSLSRVLERERHEVKTVSEYAS